MQPDYSPWGEIQALDTIYPGIHLITAPGHGGIAVEWPTYLELSSAARKCGFREGGCLRKIAVNRWCFGNSLTAECGRLPAGSQTPQNLNRKLTALFGYTTRTTGRNGKQAIPFPSPRKRPREEKRSLPAERRSK